MRFPASLSLGATALAVAALLTACMDDADSERFDQSLGFYDVDASGAARAIRNDLRGTLGGMVQFAQSHVVDPAGNEGRNMPNVVSNRQALVLFTPQGAVSGPLYMVVKVDGAEKLTLPMKAPSAIDRSDFVDAYGRPNVLYTKRAWSVSLPWDVMHKGLSFVVRAADGREGELAADQISFAAPAHVTVWGIRLGMLTDPPVNADSQPMLSDPAVAATDYFQTLPIAQLTVASYEDVRLDKVMIGDGTIVSGASAVNGDVYSGDLREDVGKAQFSAGINLANYGVPSSRLNSQAIGQTTTQFVYHHAAGNYANGRVVHGLSGGSAIGTLYDSAGNEWSHEIGHHFGMGHYPGSVPDKADYFWSAHHADSGWGYMAHRKRFRSNLAFDSNVRDGLDVNGVPNKQSFKGLYSYNADAMAGGWVATERLFSRYTHYTGYTAQRMQGWLNRPWVDAGSASGYSQFDAANGKVVASTPAGRAAPTRAGVPVFTLLGGYDPVRRVGLMYGPARANFGHVFDKLAAPDPVADACWISVSYADGRTWQVALAATRLDGGLANKFHVNVAQSDQPTNASLNCRLSGVVSQLSTTTFPRGASSLAAAVVVGEQAGFDALAARELPDLQSGLLAVQASAEPLLDRRTQILLDSWRDKQSQLSVEAQAVIQRRDAWQGKVKALDLWMDLSGTDLDGLQADAVKGLRTRLRDNGWADAAGDAPKFVNVKGEGNQCLALKLGADNTLDSATLVVVPAAACAKVPEQGWLLDARGALRNGRFPAACLTLTPGNKVAMRACDTESVRQEWTWTSDYQLKSKVATNLSLDINRATLEVSPYSSHGGTNQQWRGLTPLSSPWLSFLSQGNVQRLYRVLPLY
jgi:hypothetical protein